MSRVHSDNFAVETFRQTNDTSRPTLEQRIDVAPGWWFAWLSVLYFLVVFCLSSMKLLWLDELITLHIAKTGGLASIWQALSSGADPNPPITYILVHYSRAIFGDHEFAYRLPAALGYWVGLISLFQYLRGRIRGTWALGGTVLLMCMAAFEYSFESRSYAIFFGLAMLAFFCWTRVADDSRSPRTRWLALVGMVCALAAGISTNYFAVLAFFPVAAGEATRTFLRARSGKLVRSIDWRVWGGMLIAASPLLIYRPLIAHSIAQFAPYAWNKVSLDQATDSYTEMVEVVLIPILALFVVAVVAWIAAARAASVCPSCRGRILPAWLEPVVQERNRWPIPPHEAAGVLFFMLYPFLGYAIASIHGGMLSPRFVIPVCFGFAIAATVVSQRLFGNLRRAGIVFLGFAMAWFLCREAVVGYWYEEQKQCFYKVVDDLPPALQKLPADASIAIPDPLLALTFEHYAPPALRARVVFPVDFPAIRYFRHDDSPEENLWAGRNFLYRLPIETVASFQHQAHWYLIIADKRNWMLNDLRVHRYRVEHLPIDPRAENIGGFTPLAHGTPQFYVASWDHPLLNRSPVVKPVPFRAAQELPTVRNVQLPPSPEVRLP
ncbi:MAG: ArnT family glycosyltransferase [Acidobacteriota bacterium]